MIYRTLADTWREMEIPVEEALHYTDLAETDLRDAMRIFTTSVREPIREVQVRNEMASCYRARHFLLVHKNASDSEIELAFTQSRLHFRNAIKVAQEHAYFVEELDSLQDLAVLFTRDRDYNEAERLLERIEERIPADYKIHSGEGLAELAVEECADAYYKVLGQVHLLYGAIDYERGQGQSRKKDVSNGLPGREPLLRTARHYLLALAYFNRYSGESFVKRLTYARIYRRFQQCPPRFIEEITQKHLPNWVEEYKLPRDLVRSLFQDVFGIFP
jgi:hypothetical protein